MSFDEIMPLISTVNESSWGQYIGIHAHIGSQILDMTPFYDLISILVQFITQIKTDLNVDTHELNCGGGFGIQYLKSDALFDIPVIIQKMATELKLLCESNDLILPKLIFEPGRSIIATAGVTLYRAGTTKVIPNIKNYLFVDGGMADNPRPIMYQSKHTFDVVSPSSTIP